MAIFCLALSHVGQAQGLTELDVANAQQLANAAPWPSSTRNHSEHELGVQTVSVEMAERKKNSSSSHGQVYQFNHFTGQSRVVTIDLDTGTVISQSAINSVHLPLSKPEIQFAIDLLRLSELLDQMRAEQINRGVTAFSSIDELDVKASIFTPTDSEHPCQIQRCALLSLFDKSSTVFSLEPLVMLSTGNITTLPNQ